MNKLKSLNNRWTLMILLFSIFLGGCVKKEFDKPPIGNLPVGEVKTIAELISMYDNASANEKPIVFDYDATLYAVVNMDETSGNIYKSVFVEDNTGAINLRFTGESGLRTGDSVQVYLRKAILNDYNKLYQIDNLNADSNIVILANKKYPEPEVVTIPQIMAGGYQAKLIKLENVQFISGDLGKNYADANGYGNRFIEDCNGNTMIIRTSNYANFATKALPEGKGNLIAVVGIFNTTYQLYIRTVSEVDMTGDRCGGGGGGGGEVIPVAEVNENFNSVTADQDIAFTGWTNIAEAGTRKWQGKVFSGNGYAQATAYNSGLTSMVSWMITPPVIMDQKKYLRFNTAKAFYAHNDNTGLTVWASTDFDGTNIAGASWTQLNVTVAGQADADHTFIESGDYDLSPFIGNDYVFIAFKYRGSDTESTSYRVDDVYIGTEAGGGGGGGGTGGGTQEDPYTIAQAIENNNATPYVTGWIKGYIVGSVREGVTQVTSGDDILFNPPFQLATNVLLADNINETDYTKCVIVNLPAGTELRTQVNLLDTPGNHKKWLNVTGTLRTYFGQPGLRDCPGTASDFVLEGGGGGGGGGDAIFTEEFTTTLGSFSHFTVVGPQIWEWADFDGGCAKMSGYANSTNNANEDWLVSPAINLSGHTGSVLEIRQAANFVSNQWDLLQVMISSDYDGTSSPAEQGTWTELTVPNRPAGNNWTFVNSGPIDISAYNGQSAVYVAFKYRSTTSVSSTWEISKVEVK